MVVAFPSPELTSRHDVATPGLLDDGWGHERLFFGGRLPGEGARDGLGGPR